MPLIDNKTRTLLESLRNALSSADSIDIQVGFFYFSGFHALAKELENIKVRILVGLEVDATLIPDIAQASKEVNEDLTRFQPRKASVSRSDLKTNYIQSLVGFMNYSNVFDDEGSLATFDLFMKKIQDGSLEIRKTIANYHDKYYVVHNKEQYAQQGDFPGTVFMGSSNLTYNGLAGQGELNDSFRDPDKFSQYQKRFDSLWDSSESISIVDRDNADEFVKEVKPKVWRYQTPSPYNLYIRVLHELFGREDEESVATPGTITNGLYHDLEYQIDAVKMGIDRINRYDGVVISDVVGLGKSIVSSAIARNLDMQTVIIAPPHLLTQWEDYKEEFGLRGSKVFSSGKIDEVFERYKESSQPLLLLIDEAHRYRNEDTQDYKMLHQICRSNPGNKVMLLTATPFNNDPKDVFALIRLFQTPGRATVRSVDNLSLRFRELIDRYRKLRREITKGLSKAGIDKEAEEIAIEQRRLIETVVVRRSRLDLKKITRYRKDLERQGIEFAEVKPPELMEYDLGPLHDLYAETLTDLSDESDSGGFIGARYKPATYVQDRKKFIKLFGDQLDETDLQTAQQNLASFMRRLLVTRFESSKYAFQTTLDKMIDSNQKVQSWWHELGKVPIMKKGQIPDPSAFEPDDAETEEVEDLIGAPETKDSGLIAIDKELLDPKFIEDLEHDSALLEAIRDKWFRDKKLDDVDPKLDNLEQSLSRLLKENEERKIVVFSSYSDTVNYLRDQLKRKGHERVMSYTGSDATEAAKKSVRNNFDASIPEDQQENDFDILLATDAISEGFNLHRAGVIINYDIPYNPTRVIQRVGRINRINKKVFDSLHVYNCFPTAIGEEETRVKKISTLKIQLINAVLGSDTKTLTKDEELESFFKDEFTKSEAENEQVSWDAVHREEYDGAKDDPELLQQALQVPPRSRIRRSMSKTPGVVVFGQKGDHSVFTLAPAKQDAQVISAEVAVDLFQADRKERAEEVSQEFGSVFALAREKLFAKHEMPKIKGRRADAIKNLTALGKSLTKSTDHCEDVARIIKTLDDISEGTLKDLAQLDMSDIDAAYSEVLSLVPKHFVRSVLDRVEQSENESELLLFAEELKN